MIRDITLGQYYSCDSPIHKMDPRTKILWIIFYMVALFAIKSIPEYALLLTVTTVVIGVSKVPLKFIMRGLKPVLIIVLFTVVLNVFLTDGEKVFSIGSFVATKQGISLAVKMALRIVMLIMGTSLLTFTTTPTVLTGGLEALLKPFKKIGLPVSEFVMMMSIALRFIPTLLDETDKIIKAQTSRGADFGSGGPIKRIKSMLPILIPLFVSSFRRADELATAMECRCYSSDGVRTSYRKLSFGKYDLYALVFTVLLCGILVGIKVVF